MESSLGTGSSQNPGRPLIVAAYLHSDPRRKRRVKVPPNIQWEDFLRLFYSRFDIAPNAKIEIFDEKGIEIVSVDDLVENDILVVVERMGRPDRLSAVQHAAVPERKGPSRPRLSPSLLPQPAAAAVGGARGGEVGLPPELPPPPPAASAQRPQRPPSPSASTEHSQELLHEHDPSSVSVPRLAHFIQSNSFGYYFLAEVEHLALLPAHGKIKRIHCIVKVPHCKRTSGEWVACQSPCTLA